MVDVYRQPYIPFYLVTREFFELARDRLRPGGVVIVNVGHPEGQQELDQVLGATMADVFGTVRARPERGHEHDDRRHGFACVGAGACAQADAAAGASRDRRSAAARASRRGSTGGTVYTDDKAPVEWLVDKSIVEYAADGE